MLRHESNDKHSFCFSEVDERKRELRKDISSGPRHVRWPRVGICTHRFNRVVKFSEEACLGNATLLSLERSLVLNLGRDFFEEG